jgi:hypothetical protein
LGDGLFLSPMDIVNTEKATPGGIIIMGDGAFSAARAIGGHYSADLPRLPLDLPWQARNGADVPLNNIQIGCVSLYVRYNFPK